ncbi:hypothetical protein WAF17_21125 [Bernardetia sp. ABR2-2B]|uniref:hypothetical protein n=1 Tax=Bernardetia sp. ABR2-2B TaxID=3127472 RepID=UPI0030D45434
MFDLATYLKSFESDKRPPVFDKINKDYERAIIHTQGESIEPLLKNYRITEKNSVLKRRIELYEPITEYAFGDTLRALNNALDYKLINIECKEDTTLYMNEISFWQTLYNKIIPTTLDDPNAFVVAMPQFIDSSKPLAVQFWIVNYKNVVDFSSEHIVFKKQVNQDFTLYYIVTKNYATRFYRKNSNWVVANNPNDPNYYFVDFSEAPLKNIPAKKLGGLLREKDGVNYYKSFLSPAFAHANLATKNKSDWQLEILVHHLLTLMKRKPCDNDSCNQGYIYEDDQKKQCPTCQGTGVQKITSNINDVMYLDFEHQDFMNDISIEDIVKYATPPVEGIKMKDEIIERDLARMEKALNINDIYLNQSGAAKDLDMKGKDALVNVIGERVFSVVEFCFQICQDFRNILNKREIVRVTIPDDFRKVTISAQLEIISELKEKGVPLSVLSTAYRKLYKMMYQKDLVAYKINIYQITYDKLHLYASVNEKRLAASNDEDFEYSIQLSPVLQQIAYRDEMGFLKMNDSQITDEVSKLMKLPQTVQERDDLGELI